MTYRQPAELPDCGAEAPDTDPAVMRFLANDWSRLPPRKGVVLRLYDHAVKAEAAGHGLVCLSINNVETGDQIATALTPAETAAETARAFVSAILNTRDEMLMQRRPHPQPE